MKRIAFFVEGQTEQIFVNKLLTEIAERNSIKIELFQLRGGTSVPKLKIPVPQNPSYTAPSTPSYEAWIFDCGSDEKVKSDILDNISNLSTSGFSEVIGIRDLFPIAISELTILETRLNAIPHSFPLPIPYTIVVAVSEIEAWFLSECKHFQCIDSRLTNTFIKSKMKFDPCVDDMTLRQQPSKDLNNIYQLVGQTYNKRKNNVERTVECLDYTDIYVNLKSKITQLDRLISKIDNFLI